MRTLLFAGLAVALFVGWHSKHWVLGLLVVVSIGLWVAYMAWDSQFFEDEKAAYRGYKRDYVHGMATRRGLRRQKGRP